MGRSFLVKQSGSGGGAGGTLSVKSLDAGTISIEYADSYDVKNPKPVKVKANETAVFKGLAAGDWRVYLNDYLRKVVTIRSSASLQIRPFSATIKVTYPAHSTCTCSCGNIIFEDANETDLETTVVFTVRNEGDWTILAEASDGSGRKKKTTVEIVVSGQVVNETLRYEYVIYDGASPCDYTGGWNASKRTDGYGFSKADAGVGNKLSVSATGYLTVLEASASISSKVPIDLKELKTLSFTISSASGSCTVGFSTSANSNSFVKSQSVNKIGVVTLDVSQETTSYYITLYAKSSGDTNSVEVSKIVGA